MDYKEQLKHYQKNDYISDDKLVDDAIATLEQYFSYISEDELLHHNRPMAIAYLALRYIKDKADEI